MEKEQFKESLPYWFETEEYKQFSKLAHNNFGGKPKQETLEEAKDLNYWRSNAEEDYLKVPISVLRYISELEKQQERMCNHTYILISEQGHRIIKCQKCDNTQPI